MPKNMALIIKIMVFNRVTKPVLFIREKIIMQERKEKTALYLEFFQMLAWEWRPGNISTLDSTKRNLLAISVKEIEQFIHERYQQQAREGQQEMENYSSNKKFLIWIIAILLNQFHSRNKKEESFHVT